MKVVDSPPGTTSPSSPSNSSGFRTSTASAPSRRSIAACSRKFPCTARTPTRIVFQSRFGPWPRRHGRSRVVLVRRILVLAVASLALATGVASAAGPTFSGERLVGTLSDDFWEPTTAVDLHSGWVYQAVTGIGAHECANH